VPYIDAHTHTVAKGNCRDVEVKFLFEGWGRKHVGDLELGEVHRPRKS
jgi:hypothetical protein